MSPFFQRVNITKDVEDNVTEEVKVVCEKLLNCVNLRKEYVKARKFPNWRGINSEKYEKYFDKIKQLPSKRGTEPPFKPIFDDSEKDYYEISQNSSHLYKVKEIHGVFQVFRIGIDANSQPIFTPKSCDAFLQDLQIVLSVMHNAAVKTTTFKRLTVLEALFKLHKLLNSAREGNEQRQVPHRDFYNVRKVDTHIHHTAIMNQKHLLRFIKHKLKHYGDEIVYQTSNGDWQTLAEVFQSIGCTSYDLSIDTLDMHANNTFHRFDRFNLKYNPIGESKLREIFLKTNNLIKGRYLADVTKEVFSDLESNKYVYIEPRISIYGKAIDEFEKLSTWWYKNKLYSRHVRYLIQIPRLYAVYKANNIINSFQDLLSNIFKPLFDVTINRESNVVLDLFLRQVVGFDCVDDESKVSKTYSTTELSIPPSKWTYDYDPPYSYWMYYVYANLRTLNHLRNKLGLNTFEFRPHVGEAGDINNLASAFLVADKINHGILLRKSSTLQYLYYVCQIGLAVSPLSNNRLFLDYESNPFPEFFARGLNVSLSTDDPLLLHITKDPLVEEYSCAAQVWKLSPTDLSELARNSVLQSGFEHPIKMHFLGKDYFGTEYSDARNGVYRQFANDISQTNVPDIRVLYRLEKLNEEWNFLQENGTTP